MPDQLNITNLPSSRVEFIDPRTGLMSREWYRFFLNLFNLTGGGNNQTSLDDLQLSPPSIPFSGVGTGTVTSVNMTVPTGLVVSGNPITTSGTLAVTFDTGYAIPTTAKQAQWDTAYSERQQWDGGATNLVAATGRTSLGATTVGGNMFTLTNPSAVTFPQFNADNTVSALTASAAFNALSPITTTGDLIIGNGTNSATKLAIGANTYVLTSNGTTATWAAVSGSGATITNDTTTATNVYPTFAAATSGSLATVYTSNANLLYKPSTGEFLAQQFNAGNGIYVNNKTVATSYTIATGNSGMSAGPITIASGQTVTVASGSRWVVL